MSILLDALRKSEKSQKPVEPPSIHGDDQQLQEPEPIKSSYVIALVVGALLLIGWLLWKQYYADDVGYRPPVRLPAGKAVSSVPEVPGLKKQQIAPAPTPAPTPTSAPAPQKTPDTGSGRPRTPVESYQMSKAEEDNAALIERLAKEALAAKEKKASTRNNKRAEPSTPAESKPAVATAKAPGKAVTANKAPAADGVMPAGAGRQAKSPSSSTESYQSPEPEPISYWELPDSVRNGVPEIKFSVLVYAEHAENRFVLINGERLVEGDELKPGLVVEHIRRDGVVFSYRLYQFFVKR